MVWCSLPFRHFSIRAWAPLCAWPLSRVFHRQKWSLCEPPFKEVWSLWRSFSLPRIIITVMKLWKRALCHHQQHLQVSDTSFMLPWAMLGYDLSSWHGALSEGVALSSTFLPSRPCHWAMPWRSCPSALSWRSWWRPSFYQVNDVGIHYTWLPLS